MYCYIDETKFKVLATYVTKKLLTALENNESVDIKALMQDVYNLAYAAGSNKVDKHAQALDYTRQVPSIVNKVLGRSSAIHEHLNNSKIDWAAFHSMLQDLESMEADLAKVEKYLNLTDQLRKDNIIKINDSDFYSEAVQGTLDFGETPKQSEEEAKESAKAKEEMIKDGQLLGSSTVWSQQSVNNDIKRYGDNRAVHVGDIYEVTMSESDKEEYDFYLNVNNQYGHRLQPPAYDEADPTQQYIVEKLKNGERVFIQVTENYNSTRYDFVVLKEQPQSMVNEKSKVRDNTIKTMQKLSDEAKGSKEQLTKLFIEYAKESKNLNLVKQLLETWIKRDFNIPSILIMTPTQYNIIKEAIANEEKARAVEELPAEQGKKQALVNNPVDDKFLQSLPEDIRLKMINMFMGLPTMLSTEVYLEAKYGKFAPEGKDRVPMDVMAARAFNNSIRTILRLLYAEPNLDSSKIQLDGKTGVYLTAMSIDKVATYTGDTLGKGKGEKEFVLVITDKDGIPFKFTPEGNVADYGAPVSLRMKEVDSYYENGEIIESRILNEARQLTKIQYPEYKSMDTTELNSKIRENVERMKVELTALKSYRDYLLQDKNNILQFDITGGTMGYVSVNPSRPTKINKFNKAEKITFKNAQSAAELQPGMKQVGVTYATTPGLYGAYIEVDRPALIDTPVYTLIQDLLFEPLIDSFGNSMGLIQRLEILGQFIDTNSSTKLSIIEDVNEPLGYKLLISGKLYSPTTERVQAKQAFETLVNSKATEGYFTEAQVKAAGFTISQESLDNTPLNQVIYDSNRGAYTKVVSNFRLDVKDENLNSGVVTIPSIETNEQGVKILKMPEKATPIREYMGDMGFAIDTPDVDSNGFLNRINAVLSFFPTRDIEPVVEKVETKVQEDKDEDIIDLLKTKSVKAGNKSVTQDEIDKAERWYNANPLSKKVPFKDMLNALNNANPSAIARFTVNGIILYKGSDKTDLYHEAWHGFSQLFLTIDEKIELYNEVRKQFGTFKDYTGKVIRFKDASYKQIEEYLAESFRDYMLNPKPIKSAPKRTNFFEKILHILRELFGTLKPEEVFNPTDNIKVRELFDNLRFGNFKNHTYDVNNMMFGEANQGIISKQDTLPEDMRSINEQNAMLISDMVDSLIIEYAEKANSLTNSNKYTAAIVNDPKYMLNAYIYAQRKLTKIFNNLNEELDNKYHYLIDSTKFSQAKIGDLVKVDNQELKIIDIIKTDDQDILVIEKALSDKEKVAKEDLLRRIKILDFALSNFGNVTAEQAELEEDALPMDIIMSNATVQSGNGRPQSTNIIEYHMRYSENFMHKKVLLDFENMSEEDMLKKSQRNFDRPGNDKSLYDLAKTEIIYLIKTLPARTANGVVTNEYGIQKLADFKTSWNRIVRALEHDTEYIKLKEDFDNNFRDPKTGEILPNENQKQRTFFDIAYEKLVALQDEYPPIKDLLKRLGDPSRMQTDAEMNLWTNFMNVFNMPRVNLVQTTITKDKDENYTMSLGRAQGSLNEISQKWNSDFIAGMSSAYVKKDAEGYYLDLDKIVDSFPADKALANPYEFYKAIGFNFSDNPKIRRTLGPALNNPNAELYNPGKFVERINKLKADGVKVRNLTLITDNLGQKFNNLVYLEYKHSDVFTNWMVSNAEGNTQFEHTLPNSMLAMVNSVNNATNYQALMQQPHMQHLDIDRNPNAKASSLLKAVFYLEDAHRGTRLWGQRKQYNNKPVTIRVVNLSGALIIDEALNTKKGTASATADEYTKFIYDQINGYYGVYELPRHADKSTSYAVIVDAPLGKAKTMNQGYIPIERFVNPNNINAHEVLEPYLLAELKRMRLFNSIPEDQLENYDFDFYQRGKEFNTFHDVLEPNLKNRLEQLTKTAKTDEELIAAYQNDINLKNEIAESIKNYFQVKYEENVKLLDTADFVPNDIKNQMRAKGVAVGNESKTLVRFNTVNQWIANVESMMFLYGDTALYNHKKEEFHKRNAGIGSTGIAYRNDQAMLDFINSKYDSSYAASLGERLGLQQEIQEANIWSQEIKTAVIEEVSVTSAYYEDYTKVIGDKAKPYAEMAEADGQGLISFDGYRALKRSQGEWTSEHEELFQRIIKKDPNIKPADIKKFFSPVKAQYWGPLKTDHLIPLIGFHKFSLAPIIPNVNGPKRKIDIIHDKMVREGITYITFQSGSKVSTITKKGKADKVYKNKDRALVDAMTDLGTPGETYTPYFTPNVIFTAYLKDQVKIHDEFKGNVIFSTQLRKLIEDGLMENGLPRDAKSYALLLDYENNLSKLTALYKANFLKQLGWKSEMINGEEVLSGNKSNLISLVRNTLVDQDYAEHHIEYLNTEDLSSMLTVENIEKLINAMLVKKLVKQKINGEALVQLASTFFESEDRIGGFDKATGSNDLPFYKSDGKSPTKPMKVKIALQNDFIKLLRGKHIDGKPIKTIQRLNEMLKNEEWLNTGDNRKMIRMTAVRIPVQGLNSMEFMEIAEFLEPGNGNIIVLPTEIVAKSGGDYDIDKLTVMMPNITTINGVPTLYKSDNRVKKSEEALKEDLTKERKKLQPIIDRINAKYDAKFENYDKEDFKFTEEEIAQLSEINKEINTRRRQVRKLDKKSDQLLKEEFTPEIAEALADNENARGDVELEIESLYAERSDLIKQFSSEAGRRLNEQREAELKPHQDKLDNINRKLNAISAKAIQNDLMTNIWDILSLPSNFKSLITPNSKDLLYDAAQQREKTREYSQFDNVHGDRTETISPTRIFETRYNLYKHQSNNIGMQTLGLGAIDNTYNTLFNRIGAYMNPYVGSLERYQEIQARYAKYQQDIKNGKMQWYELKDQFTPEEKKFMKNFDKQVLKVNHNTMSVDGNTVISLSHLNNTENIPISDIINQAINGWVDVAKDSWIFNIHGNKELTPALLFMTQAGVSRKDAINLLSNPFVQEYLKEQRLAKSTFAEPLGKKPAKENLFRIQARDNVLINPKNGFGFTMGEYGLEHPNVKQKDLFTDVLVKQTKNVLNNRAQFSSNELATSGSKNINSQFTDTDRAIFLHFLQIEEMAKAIRDLKMRTNVDTNRDKTLFAAADRQALVKELEEEGRLPGSLVGKIAEESPISSFFIQDFQNKLLGNIFGLRNHPYINEVIIKQTKDRERMERYGDKEAFSIAFKNDLINFIFQNELNFFDINAKDFRGYPLNQMEFTDKQRVEHPAGVYVKDDKIYMDPTIIKNQFFNKTYISSEYANLGLQPLTEDMFDNEFSETAQYTQYVRYVLQREVLRSQKPLDSLRTDQKFLNFKTDMVDLINKGVAPRFKILPGETRDQYRARALNYIYESFLNKEALIKVYNNKQLFEGDYSFADEFVRLYNEYFADNKSIRERFPVLDILIPNKYQDKITGVTTSNLYYEGKLDARIETVYHDNLKDLTDPSEIVKYLESPKDSDINAIVEFFSMFPAVAMIQSGLNLKSRYSLLSIVPQDGIQEVLREPITTLKEKLDKGDALSKQYIGLFSKMFKLANASRAKAIRGKNYVGNITPANIDYVTNLSKELRSIGSIQNSKELERVKKEIAKPIVKHGVEELFNENPELANAVYSKLLTNSGISAENLLSLLEKENIVEKDCSGGKLKAKDGIRSKFTKGSQWEIYEIFEGKSHKQGGIEINIKNNQINFTNKNGSIKAKYGLVISKDS